MTPPPAAASKRRAEFPHHLIAPGFEPDRSIVSPLRRARTDVFERMRANHAARARMRATATGSAGHDLSSVPDVIATVPGQDTVRIALLRIDFLNDRDGSRSSGNGRFELDPPDTMNRPYDPTPHDRRFFEAHGEALRRYYRDQTAGRTVFEFTVYPTANDSAFHLTDMADHGPWAFSPDIYNTAVRLFRDCLVAADTTESIPWGTFDRVCIIHAGSDLQSDVNQDSPLDIPTFTIGVADSDAVALGPTKQDTVFAAVVAPETIRQDGYEGVINAVLAHEFGHLVYGYRDVYDVVSGFPTVGYWDLMDVGNLVGNAMPLGNGGVIYLIGLLPPSIDPWQKRLVYEDVPAARFPSYGLEDSLRNSAQGSEVLRVPLSGEEYYLIENRLDDLNRNGSLTLRQDPTTGVILGPAGIDTLEYDYLLPGPGALVWHVDESVADFFGPRADPGFGLNTNPARFGLQIEEADGLDDLGDFNSPYALGTFTDPWSSETGGQFNYNTIPKLRTNSRTDPHLEIEFTSPPGRSMALRVTRLWDLAGWPVRVVQPPEGISPVVSPLGTDVEPRIAWTGGDSTVHVRKRDGTSLTGGPSDAVFRSGRALGPVAVVHAIPGPAGPRLAVADVAPAGESGGRLTIVTIGVGGVPTVQHVDFPVPITAGPACALPPAPGVPVDALVYVGLANGEVVSVAVDATVGAPRVVGTVTGRVNGLAVEGRDAYATSDQGKLWGASIGEVDAFPAGHLLQPILFSAVPAPVEGCMPIEGGGLPYVGVVDRTAGAFGTFGPPPEDGCASGSSTFQLNQSRPLGEPVNAPALDDVDGDGLPEVVFTTASGKVGYWNTNGSLSPGWPPEVEREGFASGAGPITLRIPSVDSTPLLLASLGNGVLSGLKPDRKNAPGFPLGLSVSARGTPAVDTSPGDVDGPPLLFVAGGDTLLYGFSLLIPASGGSSSGWSSEGGGPGRAYSSSRVYSFTSGGVTSPVIPGSLVCFPNPARQKPVTFAFRLSEPARVSVRIFDSAAHEVDSFERDGSSSDNALVWDPSGRKSGLYVARIEVAGQVFTQPFAIIR
ncbi:MAG: hypothetical protein ACREOU_07325 [Candidatus Eiseniibacteriota bacterium]